MDLRLLDYFLRVAESGSLNRAASELHLTQPALSRHITRLEHELGHALFLRHRSGVQLTEVGLRLIDSAKGLLNQAALLREDIDKEPSGQVAMGLTASMLQLVTLPAIAEMRQVAPRVTIRVFETNNDTLLDHMRRGMIDFGIIAMEPRFAGDFDLIELIEDPLVLVRRRDDPPLGAAATLADVAALPLVCPARPSIFRATLETALRQAHLPLSISIEGETLGFAAEMVKLGAGQTILPACALYNLPDLAKLSVARIDGLAVTWALAVNRKRGHVPAVRRFVELLRNVVNRRAADGSWPMRETRELKHDGQETRSSGR